MGWWFTTAAVVVCVQQCHSAPATPHARSTSSQNQPLVDGKCLTSLQNVCPFVFGASCTTCAANPAVTAVCSAGNVSVYCGTDTGLVHSTSVAHLSTPRRDLSATSVGGMAVFAGGCADDGTGTAQYVCDKAVGAVDIFSAAQPFPPGVKLTRTVQLSEPRGWICTAAAGGGQNLAVLAGGGTSGTTPHSTAGDVVDLDTGEITHFPNALSVGRWGIGCTVVGESTYFTGGKVTVSGYSDAYTTGVIDIFTPATKHSDATTRSGATAASVGTWAPAPYNLSVPRESTAATAVGGSLLVAGGWKKADGRYQGDNTVDLFPDPSSGAASTSFTLATDAFDVGAAVVGDTAYIVGNGALYTYSGSTAGTTTTLPQALVGASSMDGGGLIPGSHMQQNGVTVGPWVCYYGGSIDTSALPPALYCLHTVRMRWARLPCSVPHRGGAIALVGNSTVVIAGGFDPAATNAPATDVVDVFVLEV